MVSYEDKKLTIDLDLFGKKRIAELEEQNALLRSHSRILEQKIALLEKPKKRRIRPRVATLLTAFWIAVLAFVAGGVLAPHIHDAPMLEPKPVVKTVTVKPDYSACISTKTAAPKPGPTPNQYQTLVNALYDCGVYGSSTAAQASP